LDYPTDKLLELARRLQFELSTYRRDSSAAITSGTTSFISGSSSTVLSETFNLNPGPTSGIFRAGPVSDSLNASAHFMAKVDAELLPDIQETLAEVEALLHGEEKSLAETIRPIAELAQHLAQAPANPLAYVELASSLTRLAGHLEVRIAVRPEIFVGFRYTEADEQVAAKFMKLFFLEGLTPVTAKIRKPEDVNKKVKSMIAHSEGVAIIFTKEEELKEGGWTTSTWLSDEKAFAIGRDKPVIMFFEKEIAETVRKGIQGSLEYIPFARAELADALLESVEYIRAFRQKVLERT